MRHTHQYHGLAVTALFFIASCASPDAAPTDPAVIEPHVWAAKGGPPPQDSVRLVMTVSDDPAFQVGSDVGRDYIDGAEGMRAIIDQYGNLQITPMNANNSTPPQRRLAVRYLDSLAYPLADQWNFKILSNRVNNGNPRIQDMTVGSSLCYNFTIAHRTLQRSYVDAFNVALDAGASYALITRTDPATWVITSGGTAKTGLDCGVDNMMYLTGTDLTVRKNGDFTVGLVLLPFSITLRLYP